MQRLIILICLVLAAVWTVVVSGLSIPFSLINEKAGHVAFRIWGKGWCWLFGVRVKIVGDEVLRSGKPLVLTSNHTSIFDIFVAASLPIDFKWILKREIMWIPVLGWAIAAMRNYQVRRDGSGKDLKVMKRVEEGLKEGMSVFLFPEGTRSKTGELLPFKKGAFRVAENSQVPLCPMAFIGTFPISPKGALPRRWGHRVTVRVGKPFSVSEAGGIPQADKKLRSEIQSLIAAGLA